MNILAFGAHPDDIELGCAGTLRKFVNNGHKVYLCVLSEGQEAGNPRLRRQEQEEAARKLGAHELIWGKYHDTKITVCRELISFLQDIVDKVQPDEVYVNYPEDTHQDHRALAQGVISATRYIKRVLYYEDYTSCNFDPTIFVDIQDVMEEKIYIMESFSSQITKFIPPGMTMLESIKAVANFRGFQGKLRYSEGFVPLRYHKIMSD